MALSPSRGRKGKRCFVLSVSNGAGGSGTISCFPLRGNAALAAKGCTRLRVEMKRKGGPDRQTAACLGECHFEALAVQHPRATTWPSPPQGGARFSGTISCFPLRGNAALAAKGCTRLRVEMKRKGCPDRQTAACLGEYHLRLLPCSTPRHFVALSAPVGSVSLDSQSSSTPCESSSLATSRGRKVQRTLNHRQQSLCFDKSITYKL